MKRWEYAYIELLDNADTRPIRIRDFAEFAAEVQQAGDEGWEAVGQISLTLKNQSDLISVPYLLLKRPVEDDD